MRLGLWVEGYGEWQIGDLPSSSSDDQILARHHLIDSVQSGIVQQDTFDLVDLSNKNPDCISG